MAEPSNFRPNNDQQLLLESLTRSPDVRMLVEHLLVPWLDHTDRRLRTAINDFQKMQGQACALERLIEMLTVKPQRPVPVRRPIKFGDDTGLG